MERPAAERIAEQHPGAVVGLIVRGHDGTLIIKLPDGFDARAYRLVAESQRVEGAYVVVMPIDPESIVEARPASRQRG